MLHPSTAPVFTLGKEKKSPRRTAPTNVLSLLFYDSESINTICTIRQSLQVIVNKCLRQSTRFRMMRCGYPPDITKDDITNEALPSIFRRCSVSRRNLGLEVKTLAENHIRFVSALGVLNDIIGRVSMNAVDQTQYISRRSWPNTRVFIKLNQNRI